MDMNQNDNSQSEPTPGKIIKRAREVKNIAVSEAAENLLLSKQIIIDIENDDYSRIPAQVYAEGYLKAYAQLLQISADNLITGFRQLHIYSQADEPAPEPDNQTVSRLDSVKEVLKNKHIRLMMLGSFIGLILILLIIFSLKFGWFNNETDLDLENGSAVINGVVVDGNEPIKEDAIPIVTINVSDDIAEFES